MKNLLIVTLFGILTSVSASARDGVIDTIQLGLRLPQEAIQVLRDFAGSYEGSIELNEKHILIGQILTKNYKVDLIFVIFKVELAAFEGDPGRTLYCHGDLVPIETGDKVTWTLTGQVCRN